MRIEAVELRIVQMRLKAPFTTSGWTQQDRRPLLVRVWADGLFGIGECTAGEGPFYSPETVETAWHVLGEFLIPAVLGRLINRPADALAACARVRGHPMAKAALEMALADLCARGAGQSLSGWLGGVRDRVASGVSVGVQPSLAQLLDVVDGYLQEGYQRIKVKIRPGWDVEVVRALRERFGDILLTVDANAAYRLRDSAHLRELDAYGLLMIEQPLEEGDLDDHALLQSQLQTAICLDESISDARAAERAIVRGACRIINIKPGRVGGLAEAQCIHDIAARAGVPVWCGGMLETGIGRAHNVALASLPNFRLPGDTSASSRYWAEDLVDPAFVLQADGTLAVPVGPGIGVTLREDLMAARTERTLTRRA